MTQLSSVIGSILRDIISAQHEANLYSAALSENYGKDGRVKDFRLPGVFISDMELELKYALLSTDENGEQFNIKYNRLRQFAKSLCEEAAGVAVAGAVSAVLDAGTAGDCAGRQFFSRLRSDVGLNLKFRRFLSRNMLGVLGTDLYEAVDCGTGEVAADVVVGKLMCAVTGKFLNAANFARLFKGEDGAALMDAAVSDVRDALNGLVERLSKGVNFKRVKAFPRLDVAVTAEELSDMPKDAVHVFRMKFSPTTYSMPELEDAREVDDFDME